MNTPSLDVELGVVTEPGGEYRKDESDRLFAALATYIRDADESAVAVTKKEVAVPEGTLGVSWGGALKAVLAGPAAFTRLLEFVWRAVKWMTGQNPRPFVSLKFVHDGMHVEVTAKELAAIDDLGQVRELATALIRQLGLGAPPRPAP